MKEEIDKEMGGAALAARLVALHRQFTGLDGNDARFVRVAEALSRATADALGSWLFTCSDEGLTLHVEGEPPCAGLWLASVSLEEASRRLRLGDVGVFALDSVGSGDVRRIRTFIIQATAARWHEGRTMKSGAAQLAVQALAYEPYRHAVDPPVRNPHLIVGTARRKDRVREQLIRDSMQSEYGVTGRGLEPVWDEARLEQILALADEIMELN